MIKDGRPVDPFTLHIAQVIVEKVSPHFRFEGQQLLYVDLAEALIAEIKNHLKVNDGVNDGKEVNRSGKGDVEKYKYPPEFIEAMKYDLAKPRYGNKRNELPTQESLREILDAVTDKDYADSYELTTSILEAIDPFLQKVSRADALTKQLVTKQPVDCRETYSQWLNKVDDGEYSSPGDIFGFTGDKKWLDAAFTAGWQANDTRWGKSFDGHVYITDEEYQRLIKRQAAHPVGLPKDTRVNVEEQIRKALNGAWHTRLSKRSNLNQVPRDILSAIEPYLRMPERENRQPVELSEEKLLLEVSYALENLECSKRDGKP